jgi:hypothetical protein
MESARNSYRYGRSAGSCRKQICSDLRPRCSRCMSAGNRMSSVTARHPIVLISIAFKRRSPSPRCPGNPERLQVEATQREFEASGHTFGSTESKSRYTFRHHTMSWLSRQDLRWLPLCAHERRTCDAVQAEKEKNDKLFQTWLKTSGAKNCPKVLDPSLEGRGVQPCSLWGV